MSMTLARFVAEEAGHSALPMPPWVFGALALLAFAFLLGVTWSFRGTAQKVPSPGSQHQSGPGGHAAAADHTFHAGHPEPEDDEAHWPEHPGHH